MKPVVTLTLNPALDGASAAEKVRPTHKIRTTDERYYPGGGGVNVARVVTTLGGVALPVYLAGGPTGAFIGALLEAAGIAPHPVSIAGPTRVSHTVFERSTGLEYRFVAEGPDAAPADVDRCLTLLDTLDFDWLVISGSLPRGLPPDSLAAIARRTAARGARLVLDTSGPALPAALGPALGDARIHLLKPSIGEFRALVGRDLATRSEIEAAGAELLRTRPVDMLAITVGHEGALLVTPEGARFLKPPPVAVASATGAGDSFLGAMVLALALGATPEAALRRAVAAGAAAVLTPGTELCRREDVDRLEAALAPR